ncbi:hypothetical protein [Verrucomicrobium sp. BvORR034]|jgi:hypothetical protein|uniref:hypothetical protein n=1 Tax=Verrucomicrobium sp. BvORR034 TaxID=1396418 RepID=UPI0006785C41|nr:hypothetical protein [Verrucomicrobium sp. BvORR034]
MRPLTVLFLLLLSLLISAPVCKADVWQKAEIFLVDWDVMTRARLDPDQVRNRAQFIRKLDGHAVSDLVDYLQLSQLKPSKNPWNEDSRLVVDLYNAQGVCKTYYASRFNLCTADGTAKRVIDGRFRQYFRGIFEKVKSRTAGVAK